MIHPAEARLAILHKAAQQEKGTVKHGRKILLHREPPHNLRDVVERQTPLVSFRDIGMNSIHELVHTFKQLDEAVGRGDNDSIKRNLARLLNINEAHIDLT
jgi:hypothetical protein